MKTTMFCLMMVLGMYLSLDTLTGEQAAAATQTERFYVSGSPRGESTSGVMAREMGFDSIVATWVSPQVVRLRIEQNDYAAPQIGTNPNRVFFDGDPRGSRRVPEINMNRIGNLRITVWTSGTGRISNAVLFQWIRGRK